VSVRFLADADLNYAIVQGIRLREPGIDFKTANDAGLEGRARKGCSFHTTTGRCHAISPQEPHQASNPGVLLALRSASVGEIIESLLVIWSASSEAE
jgi:hypothetical protein